MPDCTEFDARVRELERELADTEEFCQTLLPNIVAFKQCRTTVGRIRQALERARAALGSCEAGLPPAGLQAARGRVTFLRVHDRGGFGPPNDHLDAEVVFQLDTRPGRSFGFKLRNDDSDRSEHEAMLELLRTSLASDLDVNINYEQVENQFNSLAFRIELFAGSKASTGGGGGLDPGNFLV
jgi:hypothetical protein